MSFEIVLSEYDVQVADEAPLYHVGSPTAQQFSPDRAHIMVYGDGRVRVLVSGPLLHKVTGRHMSRRGLVSYDAEDAELGQAPQWVLELLKQVLR